MRKYNREELICVIYRSPDFLNQLCKEFYRLPSDKKSDPRIFENFCKAEGGQMAILLSDDNICDNKELVIIAHRYGYKMFYHLLSKRLLSDPEIALELADCKKNEYKNINLELRKNVELMEKAIRINSQIFCSLPTKVKLDRRIAYEVALKKPHELIHLSYIKGNYSIEIIDDKKVAMAAIEKYPYSIEYCSKRIKNDAEVKQLVKTVKKTYGKGKP